MLIRRSSPVRNFTVLPNEFLQDERMSWVTRGILGEILSRPEGWQASADLMAKRATKVRGERVGEGRRAVRAAFAEAEKLGYIVRSKERIAAGAADAGQFVTVLTFYDAPQSAHQGTDTGTSVPPAETGRKARSHQGTADGTSVTGTSIERTKEKEPRTRKNSVSAVAETGSADAVASSSSHAVACSAAATKIPKRWQQPKADDPRTGWVPYYLTSKEPAEVTKDLYAAIGEMTDGELVALWTEFEQKRPTVSRTCRKQAEAQNENDQLNLDAARLVGLALMYGVRHYEGKWPAFVVPESKRPAPPEWAAAA